MIELEAMDCNRVTLDRHSKLAIGTVVRGDVVVLKAVRLKSPDGHRWVLAEEKTTLLPMGERIPLSDQTITFNA